MFLTDDVLQIDQPDTPLFRGIPRTSVSVVDAEVAERWMVNARLHPRRFRELVPVDFLEPQLVDGSIMLSLCAMRVRHAAPLWAPLSLGSASVIGALRIACRDRRDGRACVWDAEHYADNAPASPLALLGCRALSAGLLDHGGPGRLDVSAGDGLVHVQAKPAKGPDPELFPDAAAFARFVEGGTRHYAPGGAPGRCSLMVLEKRGDDAFEHCAGWEGWMRTPWGDCTIDGVYRSGEGLYRWTCQGEVDAHGEHL